MWCAIFYSCWYGFVVLVQCGQSMGNTQAMDFILRTVLFDYYLACPNIRMDVHMNLLPSHLLWLPYHPLRLLCSSPPFPKHHICCSRLLHALSQAPTNTLILTSASIRPTFWKLNQDRQGKKKHGPSFLSHPRLVRTRRTRFVHVIATAIPVDIHAHPSAGAGECQQLFTRLWSPLEIFTRVLLAPKARRRTTQRCWSLGGAPVSPWRSSLWG